jgi:hypothetical protein
MPAARANKFAMVFATSREQFGKIRIVSISVSLDEPVVTLVRSRGLSLAISKGKSGPKSG